MYWFKGCFNKVLRISISVTKAQTATTQKNLGKISADKLVPKD